jgi:hypothetical protein
VGRSVTKGTDSTFHSTSNLSAQPCPIFFATICDLDFVNFPVNLAVANVAIDDTDIMLSKRFE